MSPEYRIRLLTLMVHTEQLIAEAEWFTVEVNNDELLIVSKELAELRQVLADGDGN